MENEKSGGCGMRCAGINYCFWAKLLVAIPALPIIFIAAALLFEDPAMQAVSGTVAVIIAVLLARKIDTLNIFSGRVIKKKE